MTAPLDRLSELEIEEMLGAYALDALDPDETEIVERHLRTCIRCTIEVAEHHEVAGLMANSGGSAPDRVWGRIAAQLDEAPVPSWDRLAARLEAPPQLGAEVRQLGAEVREHPLHPVAGLDDPSAVPAKDDSKGPDAVIVPLAARRRNWLMTAAVSAVAVAAAVAAVVLGVQVHRLDRQVNALNVPHHAVTLAAEAALENPATQRVRLVPTPTSRAPKAAVVTLVLGTSDTGFIIAHGLTPLPAQETYQLWGAIRGQLISLGVLGSDPGVTAFTFDAGTKVQAFAITAEPAGGVVRTARQPVVEGAVSA